MSFIAILAACSIIGLVVVGISCARERI